MGEMRDLENEVKFVRSSLKFILRYPACTYILRKVIDKMKGSKNYILRDFGKELSEVWSSSTSTVSCGIPINLQVELVNKIIKHVLKVINVADKLVSAEEYLRMKEVFKQEMKDFWHTKVIPALWSENIKRCPDRDFTQINFLVENKLERLLLEIIGEHKIIFNSEKPIFLLRSGFRSFYFINPFHLISHAYIDGDGQNTKQKIEDFKIFLQELFKEVEKLLDGEKIAIVLFEKRFGEDPGTVVLNPILTALDIKSIIYDLESEYAWPKGPIFKRANDYVDFDPVPIIDLTTTGGTARVVVDLAQKQLGKITQICPILINRGASDLKLNGARPLVILNWNKITETFGIVPDVLEISISSKDNSLGYVWPSIFPFRNYVKDIYLYEKYLYDDRKNIVMKLYEYLEKEFKRFIVENYGIKEKDDKTYLFGWYNTSKGKEEVVRYLQYFHILCWKHIYKKFYGDEDEDYLKKPLEFLLDFLEYDREEKITVPFLPNFLEEKLKEKEYDIPYVDPIDRIHRILVDNTDRVINHLNKRVQDLWSTNPPAGVEVTEEQFEKIIEYKLKKLFEDFKNLYGRLEPPLGPAGGKHVFDDKNYEKWAKKQRKHIREVLREQLKVIS